MIGLDNRIYLFFNTHTLPPLFENIGNILNRLGKGDALFFLCILVIVAGYFLGRPYLLKSGAGGILTILAAGTAVQTIKHMIGRGRPQMNLGDFYFIGPNFFQNGFDSFPSGHAMATFAAASFFSAFYPRGKTVFYGFAASVSLLGRVALRHHFLSDVLVGALLGHFIGLLIAKKLKN